MKLLFEDAVDLTQELRNGMPVYPGDEIPSFEKYSTLEKNGVNLTKLTLGSHTGTHLDAPAHFIPGGKTVDKIPVGQFVGDAIIADLSEKRIGSGITSADLQRSIGQGVRKGDVVICYTGCSDRWGEERVRRHFTYLTKGAAEYLVSKKVRGVGIDCLSVERFGWKEPAAHRVLLASGIFIIESLNNEVKRFIGKRFFLLALPIKLGRGDGAPVRAIGIPERD